jgi:predicted transcriptional regulator
MTGRRTQYEIYWEILVFCKIPRTFTAVISRCDLNSKTGQEYLAFLVQRGYLAVSKNGERQEYTATEKAQEYISLFSRMYQDLFGANPGFRL